MSVIKVAVGFVTLVGNPLFVNVDLKSLTSLPASVFTCIPSTDLTKLGIDESVGKLIVTCRVVSNALAI